MKALDFLGRLILTVAVAAAALAQPTGDAAAQQDTALPSWNDGAPRQAILKFVADVTREGTPTFVPVPERVAVFDNDGTLWAEQPIYFQLAFALDRVRTLAPKHPEWKDQPAFKAVLAGDLKALVATGEKGLMQVMAASHAGMTTDEFATIAADWFTARGWTVVDMKRDWKKVFAFEP